MPTLQHDDDDDYEIVNGQHILKDGRSVRVPLMFADSKDREAIEDLHRRYGDQQLRGHRPGFLRDANPDTRAAAENARAAYVAHLANAWKPGAAGQSLGTTPLPGDGQDRVQSSYAEYCKRLSNEWRSS